MPAPNQTADNGFAAALKAYRDDPDPIDAFERATIKAALEGDADAGREAMRIFITGCDSGTLSRRMLSYVKDRLVDIVFNKLTPDVAFCLLEHKTRGVEYPPAEVAACYFLLLRYGRKKKDAKAALQEIFVGAKKSISTRQIEITAKRYARMQSFKDDLLLDITGTKRKELARLISPRH